MDREIRWRLGLSSVMLIAALALGYAVAVPSDDPPPVADDGVLFPPDRAVLLSGSFDVICKGEGSALEVDGKPRKWEPFQAPVHVAHIRLSPGMHEVRIGDKRRDIVVALNEMEHDGPSDWPLLRQHEMNRSADRCADCHNTTKENGSITVGELKPYKACLKCHESEDFEDTHSHPLEPIEHCQICHDLHGSTREYLLKAPVTTLCAKCHDT